MARIGNSICLLKYLCFLLYLFFQTSCSGFSFLLSTKSPSLLPLQASMKGRLWCGGNQSTTPKLLPNDRKRREGQCNFGDPATMQKASPSGWDIFADLKPLRGCESSNKHTNESFYMRPGRCWLRDHILRPIGCSSVSFKHNAHLSFREWPHYLTQYSLLPFPEGISIHRTKYGSIPASLI